MVDALLRKMSDDATYLERLAVTNTALQRCSTSRRPEFLSPSDITPFTLSRTVDDRLMAAVNKQHGRMNGERPKGGLTFHMDTFRMQGDDGPITV